MTLEQAIAEQLCKVLLKEEVDMYGNISHSIVSKSLKKYADDNKDLILKEILKTLTVEKIAEEISSKLKDVIKGIYGSSYEREHIFKDLKGEIGKHLAEKIANDLKI